MTSLTRLLTLTAALYLGYSAATTVSPASAENDGFCAANEKGNCGNSADNSITLSAVTATRYLLYDVNPPEGFNLRRDVYMRLATFVRALRKQKAWTLVLPPWGQLYHWQSSNIGEQVKLPWSKFFDVQSLQKFAPVIEMDEFLKNNEKGKPVIEEVHVLQHFKDMWDDGKEWEDRWAIEQCIDSIPYIRTGKVFKGPFWSYENITAQKVVCTSFQGHVSLLKQLLDSTKAKSIMIDHAEVALHDSYGDSTYWMARRSMRFAPHLVQIANKFRKDHLQSSDKDDGIYRPEDWQEEKQQHISGGGPYLAVHLRRKDFLWGRSREVPDLKFAAEQLTEILEQLELKTVFVATDAPKPEFAELKTHLYKFKVLRFEPSPALKYDIKDGGVAIVDQIICAHAKYFTGTHESTFSFRIQEEREIMGFPANMTFNRLCGRQESLPCSQPTKWKIAF